jgi:hypothetical protein
MSASLEVALKVVDNATKEINNFGRNLDRVLFRGNETLKLFAEWAGIAFSVQAVKAFADESIKAYEKSADAEAQLSAAIGHHSAYLEQEAAAIAEVTRFSRDDTVAAEAQLANYVKEESSIKRLMPVIADLATAKHISLADAAGKVGVALTKNNEEFGKMGVRLHGAAGSTERLTSMVDGLTKAFGGQAEALANTPLGQLDQMKNQMEEIKVEIGEKVIPVQIAWNKLVLETLRKMEGIAGWFGVISERNIKKSVNETMMGQLMDDAQKVNDELDQLQQDRGTDYLNTTLKNLTKAELKDRQDELDETDRMIREKTVEKAHIQKEISDLQVKMGIVPDKAADDSARAAADAERRKENADKAAKAEQKAFDDHVKRNDAFLKAEEDRKLREAKLVDDHIAKLETAAQADQDRLDREKAAKDKALQDDRKRMEENIRLKQMEVEATYAMGHAIMALGEMAINASVKDERKRRNMLYFMALADAAGAAVRGVYQVWSDKSTGNTYTKIALSAAVIGEIIASTAGQIASIKKSSFATGTGFARGGRSLLGEEGPEFVDLPRGARVLTAMQTKQTMHNSISFPITINGPVDRHSVGQLMGSIRQFSDTFVDAVRGGYINLNRLSAMPA